MLKRIICLTLAVLMVFSLAACKKNGSDDSEYSYYEEVIVTGDGTQTTASGDSSKTNSTTSGKNQNTASGNKNSGTASSSTGNNQNSGGKEFQNLGNAEKMKKELDFKGETLYVMREWDPYTYGESEARDRSLDHQKEIEKMFNVKIGQKKMKTSLVTEMLSGAKPEGHFYNIGRTSEDSVWDMAVRGFIASWDEAMANTGIDMTSEWYDKFNTNLNNVNGKQWAAGFGFPRIESALFYNKKHLAEVGYTGANSVQTFCDNGTWTWDKLTEMAKKSHQTNSSGEVTRWGIAIDWRGINTIILSNGGHIAYPDSSGKFVSTLKDNAVIEAAQQCYDWYNKDKIASSFDGGQWGDMANAFADKKVTFMFSGHAATGTLYSKLTADDYGVAYIPKGPRAKKYISYMVNEYCWVVPKTYENRMTEFLLLEDELQNGDGGTRAEWFRLEWIRYFHSNDQYQMWRNYHYGDQVDQVWDGESFVGGAAAAKLITGEQTGAVWVDTNHNALSASLQDKASKYTFTGKL